MTEQERKTLAYRHIGMRSRAIGESFEKMIDDACQYYRETRQADIEKTPEPMKPVRSLGDGKFIAVYTKKAQADYKGCLFGGREICFEAKATASDRIAQDRVDKNQTERLNRAEEMGATVFVLCCIQDKFFRVPWWAWKCMKKGFGHKYITADDAVKSGFEIVCKPPGYLAFLE